MLHSLSPSRFRLALCSAWLLAFAPALSLVAAPPRRPPNVRYARQAPPESPEETPAEDMPAEEARPQARPPRRTQPAPDESLPAEEAPETAQPRSRTRPPARPVQPQSVVEPLEYDRYIGDIGGYYPETGRRHGICYPQTGACGLACGGCYPCYTWGSVDFVMMFRKGQDLPPLVTTNPTGTLAVDANGIAAGALNNPSTQVLFGGDSYNDGLTTGARADGGFWLNQCQVVGLGGRFLFLGGQATHFSTDSSQNAIIGVPIIRLDPLEVGEDALLASHPTRGTGGVNATLRSNLVTGDAYLRFKFWEDPGHRLDLIAGYTFSRLDEEFVFNFNNTDLGLQQQINDNFNVRNYFEGVSLGALYKVQCGNCWTFSLLGKCALGSSRQVAVVSGSTTENNNGVVTVTPGGIFAQPTNSGRFQQSEFAILPEFVFKAGYFIAPHVEVTAGYSTMYWNRMAQVGNQIDRTINDTQFNGGTLTGAPRPEFAFRLSDYWMHGVNLGLAWTF